MTVVERLPAGVEAVHIGYHGSTRRNFDSIEKNGLDFGLTGRNFGGMSSFGQGFYVTRSADNAFAYANIAARREAADGQAEAQTEIATVYRREPAAGLVQCRVPDLLPDVEAFLSTPAASGAHELHVDYYETVIREAGVRSDGIEYFIVRAPLPPEAFD